MELNDKNNLSLGLSGNLSPVSSMSGSLTNEILRGYSAYQLAVLSGFEGTLEEWLEGLNGNEIQIRNNNYIIEWKYDAETDWKFLIDLSFVKDYNELINKPTINGMELIGDVTINAKNADTVNGHTVNSDVPSDAKFTDTVYTHPNSGIIAGIYKSVSVDEQGHVTSGTNPTTLDGYGITDAYTKTETNEKIKTALTSVLVYKGSVDNYANLPITEQKLGDVYNIANADIVHGINAGDNVAWNGTGWDILAGTVDLTSYSTTIQVENKITIAKQEVIDEIIANTTNVQASTINGNILVNGTETVVYTHPSGTNPHGTTKSDVGLGDVPNVSTNDQTPTYSEASTLEKLTSGEKLSVAFGKISKAITDFIAHIGDAVKHISSSERTNWNVAYNHSQSDHAPVSAEENQNAFSNIIVGSTSISADSKSDSLEFSGNNVTLTPDIENGKLTIGVTKDNIEKALGYIPGSSEDTNTTYTLTKSGSTIILTGSDGSITSVEDDDTETIYGVATSATLGLIKSGTDITVDENGNVTVNDDSHNHVIENIDGLQSILDSKSPNDHTHSEYINQNSYSDIIIGDVTLSADNETSSFSLVSGDNVIITADANGNIINISAKDTVYTHPNYIDKPSGFYKITVDNTGHVSDVTEVTKEDITALGIPESDTNTWRGIQDNLTSDSTTESLSANQGKILKNLVDEKVNGAGITFSVVDGILNVSYDDGL